MTNQFLQQKLAELIYELGETEFNAITTEFWDKHIYNSVPFSEKQITCFRDFIKCMLDEMTDEPSV